MIALCQAGLPLALNAALSLPDVEAFAAAHMPEFSLRSFCDHSLRTKRLCPSFALFLLSFLLPSLSN